MTAESFLVLVITLLIFIIPAVGAVLLLRRWVRMPRLLVVAGAVLIGVLPLMVSGWLLMVGFLMASPLNSSPLGFIPLIGYISLWVVSLVWLGYHAWRYVRVDRSLK